MCVDRGWEALRVLNEQTGRSGRCSICTCRGMDGYCLAENILAREQLAPHPDRRFSCYDLTRFKQRRCARDG